MITAEVVAVLNMKMQQSAPIKDPTTAVLTAIPDAGDRMRALARGVLRRHGGAS